MSILNDNENKKKFDILENAYEVLMNENEEKHNWKNIINNCTKIYSFISGKKVNVSEIYMMLLIMKLCTFDIKNISKNNILDLIVHLVRWHESTKENNLSDPLNDENMKNFNKFFNRVKNIFKEKESNINNNDENIGE